MRTEPATRSTRQLPTKQADRRVTDRPAPTPAGVGEHPAATVLVVGYDDRLTRHVQAGLRESAQPRRALAFQHSGRDIELVLAREAPTTVIYLATARSGRDDPDLDDAEIVLDRLGRFPPEHLVLVASSAVIEPSHHQPGFVTEARATARRRGNARAERWQRLEALAASWRDDHGVPLTILRPAPVPTSDGQDGFSRLIYGRWAVVPTGFDPSLQLLGLPDLVRGIAAAVDRERPGTFHLTPSGSVPLRKALRLAGTRSVPVPAGIQTACRRLGRALGMDGDPEKVDYLRYPWTASGEHAATELGFTAAASSAAVASRRPSAVVEGTDDDYGMDLEAIERWRRTGIRLLHDRYWRVEYRGIEHLPTHGAAVMTGVHRGHQPWDGVMLLHLLMRERGRPPRFLIHPSLIKFPFLSRFMTKLGGILACKKNADWVLERGDLLGIFPEGIDGAFARYRGAYKLRSFGRRDYVKLALRHRAPIVPFVTIGSAEIFPIFGKLRWPWWERVSEWPCLPITPTMSLLPLPSKWHTKFLAPIDVHRRYPPEAAKDREVVERIDDEVRTTMQTALDEMTRRRRNRFWGSIFEPVEGRG